MSFSMRDPRLTGDAREIETNPGVTDLRVIKRSAEPSMTVLIVDDHVLFAQGLEAALRERGIRVVGMATRGRDAVALARRERPDIILMDVDLPDMDGVSAGRRILSESPEVKMVALTGLQDSGLVREAIRAGFQGFVMKESSITELIASMTAVAHTQAVIPHEAAKALAGLRSEAQEAQLLSKHLTDREREVLALLVDGASSKTLAERLFLSPNTVRTHIQNICFKLQVHSRLEAVAFAVKYGILKPARKQGAAGRTDRRDPVPGRYSMSRSAR